MPGNGKPVVRYDSKKDSAIEVGQHAFVWPIDHPSDLVSNTTMVITSHVKRVQMDKGEIVEFETENTIYKAV